MDERTIESSANFTHLLEQQGVAKAFRTREFTALVKGREGNEPFTFVADSRQQCADKLTKDHGIDLVKDKYAVGYFLGASPEPMVYGNSQDMQNRLEAHLRTMR